MGCLCNGAELLTILRSNCVCYVDRDDTWAETSSCPTAERVSPRIAAEDGSQSPRSLRRRSAVARLLELQVRIPQGAWMSLSCDCCLLSGRGP